MTTADDLRPPGWRNLGPERRLNASVWLAEQGFTIGWAAMSDGKAPKRRWKSDATDDPAMVRAIIVGGRNPLVIPKGQLFIADIDQPEGYDHLCSLGLPETFMVATPSIDHRHVYLRAPEGFDVTTLPEAFPYGDIRKGDKGMVLGPWALTDVGQYLPIGTARVIAEAPQAVLDYLGQRPARTDGPERPQTAQTGGAALIRVSGQYELPERVPSGRYRAILEYTASLYGRRLSVAEMWPLVRDVLAPRFAERLTETEVRDRFERATVDIAERLGPPTGNYRETKPDLDDIDALLSSHRVDASGAVRPPEADDWLIADFVGHHSIVVIASEEGLGKSYLRRELSLRVAIGSGQFLGAYEVRGERKVVLVDEENGESIEWDGEAEGLHSLGTTRQALHGRLVRYSYLGAGLTKPDGQALLERLCDLERPGLLILDTGSLMVGEEWGDEMKEAMRFLRRLTQQYDLAVAVIVHMVKPVRDGSLRLTARRLTEVMGHWTRHADAVGVMSPAKGEGRAFWQVTKRVPRRPVYVIEQRAGLWVKVEEVAGATHVALKSETNVPPDRAEHILRDINDGLTVTGEEAEVRYGVKRRQFFNDLTALEEAGLLERDGKGLRTLTNKGLDLLQIDDSEEADSAVE